MEFTDTITLDAKATRRTTDGYLVTDARVARTGIQIYNGREVDPDNIHGLRDQAQVRVYRPADEVFHKDSLASYAYRPITVDHPSEMVTADNWRDYAVGQVGGEVVRDGEMVRVPMVVMDAAAIREVEGGKRQLSQGYTCDVEYTAGQTADGLEYDAIQRNIRANHTAIVGLARGGDLLKIGDSKVAKMVMVDGHQVELGDAAAIAVAGLQSKLDAADAKVTTLTTDAATKDTTIATLTTDKATLTAEVATLKTQLADAQVTPAKLRDAAKAYAKTVALAKAIAPAFTVTDAMDETAIKTGVVQAKLGDAAKGWNDIQFSASFESLAAGVKVSDATVTVDNMATAFDTANTPAPGTPQAVTDARTDMIKHLTMTPAERAAAAKTH